MADVVIPEMRSRLMSGIRGKDTQPEIVVRSMLHSAGFRFRLYRRDLPGRPDLVLTKWHAAVFINGCFWHAHKNCKFFRLPTTRRGFWREKLDANRSRDSRVTSALADANWNVITIWECALRADSGAAIEHLQDAIRSRVAGGIFEIRESCAKAGGIELIRSA